MTPELAAERAANILEKAGAMHAFPEQAAALVLVAAGWTRLHEVLAHAPKTIEPAEQPFTVNISDMVVKDVDPKKIAEAFGKIWSDDPKSVDEPGQVERAYYHWMITYLTPTVGGFTVGQRSGTCQPSGRSRLEMFETLAQQVMDETGLTVDGFSVLYFALEPDQIP